MPDVKVERYEVITPAIVREKMVQLMGDLPRIELFARQKVEGWDSIGFDIDGCDIRESIDKLVAL